MNYLGEIIKLFTWPAVILLSYYLSRYALKRFEKYLPEENQSE